MKKSTNGPPSRPVSKVLNFKEHDIELLKEYGFKPRQMRSVSSNRKKINKMNMRQLDRTKMLLLRNSRLCEGYPEAVQNGIMHNDADAFSKALALLSNFLAPK